MFSGPAAENAKKCRGHIASDGVFLGFMINSNSKAKINPLYSENDRGRRQWVISPLANMINYVLSSRRKHERSLRASETNTSTISPRVFFCGFRSVFNCAWASGRENGKTCRIKCRLDTIVRWYRNTCQDYTSTRYTWKSEYRPKQKRTHHCKTNLFFVPLRVLCKQQNEHIFPYKYFFLLFFKLSFRSIFEYRLLCCFL